MIKLQIIFSLELFYHATKKSIPTQKLKKLKLAPMTFLIYFSNFCRKTLIFPKVFQIYKFLKKIFSTKISNISCLAFLVLYIFDHLVINTPKEVLSNLFMLLTTFD